MPAGQHIEDVDLEAEGLLEGVESDEDREAREDLIEQLLAAGVSLEELRRAVEEERLALVPVDQVLAGGGRRYTFSEVAEKGGVDEQTLRRHLRALGLPLDDEDAVLTDADLEAARVTRRLLDAGIPEEKMLEVARVMGRGLSRTAEAMRTMVGEVFLRPGDTERDLGLRYAEVARELAPLTGPLVAYVLNAHLRELVRSDVVSRAELATGRLPGAQEVTVCFADLVGFTRLGERVPADELGGIAGRLAEMASEVAQKPVRFVKTIGDAVMLVSSETDPLLDAALELIELAEQEDRDRFPQLRCGADRGHGLSRGGDWYGQPVNLASRLTGIARPGSVLVTSAVREAAGDGFRFSNAGRRRVRGVEEAVPLFRARRGREDGEG